MLRRTCRVLSQDPYAILGVSATTSLADAKRAYRRKALKTHPDMGGSVEQFTLVHAAYEAILAGRSTLNPDPDPPPQPHAYPASAYTYEHFKQVDMTSLPEAMFIYRNMTIYTRRGGRKSVLEVGMALYATSRAGPVFSKAVIIVAEVSETGGVIAYVLNKRLQSGDRWYGGPNGQRNHEVIVHESDRLAAHFASPMSSRHAAGFHFDTDVSFAKRQYFKAAKHRMLCGYCGWAPGKLDVLIAKGRWKLVESDSVWLHNTPPEELYEAALRLPTHPID
ncbi:chaperone protein DNAj [Diplonema papillatum]|nr:chaperone protein DNAj [Diplonema papillatum]